MGEVQNLQQIAEIMELNEIDTWTGTEQQVSRIVLDS